MLYIYIEKKDITAFLLIQKKKLIYVKTWENSAGWPRVRAQALSRLNEWLLNNWERRPGPRR